MTNEAWIKSLSTQELAEYICSVYLAGRLIAKVGAHSEPFADYVNWLNKEHN